MFLLTLLKKNDDERQSPTMVLMRPKRKYGKQYMENNIYLSFTALNATMSHDSLATVFPRRHFEFF